MRREFKVEQNRLAKDELYTTLKPAKKDNTHTTAEKKVGRSSVFMNLTSGRLQIQTERDSAEVNSLVAITHTIPVQDVQITISCGYD